MNVRLSQEQRIKLLNSDAVYSIMQQILLRENKILFIELIGLGQGNRVNTNPPDVFRMGIYKLAVSMILVHNHPSGHLMPSG
ncbi:hypothetical protein GCM10011340_32090 [Roseivirga thermotolerans]|uniref:RadC-like JAB domain-containing protein n=1 Tax=Roseivirga thermotolerans TaxID=1758176 RepID=A0ABQ3IBR0_9BACT|nr:hypothetical protein GCM10011340_32090 [Roseivirga thermotolerans]